MWNINKPARLEEDDVIRKSNSENPPTPETRMDDLYDYLAYKAHHRDHTEIKPCGKNNCSRFKKHRELRNQSTITNDESMNQYLEFLYDELLKPVERFLKPEDKLVLAPSEVKYSLLTLHRCSKHS